MGQGYEVDAQGQLLTLCDSHHGTVNWAVLHCVSRLFVVNLLLSLPLYLAGKAV